MRSTLTGWRPEVADLVWVQLYSPQRPAVGSTIEERIAAGATYRERHQAIVTLVCPDHNAPGLTRWYMRRPGRDLGPAFWSGADSDWCVLEEVTDTVNPGPVKQPRPEVPSTRPVPRRRNPATDAPAGQMPLFDLAGGSKP